MGITVVNITVAQNGGILSPADLPALCDRVRKAVSDQALQGLVVLSGRLPVWAFAALAHTFHPAAGVATFDPRLGGGVVVQTHSPAYKVGDVVALDGKDAQTVDVTY